MVAACWRNAVSEKNICKKIYCTTTTTRKSSFFAIICLLAYGVKISCFLK